MLASHNLKNDVLYCTGHKSTSVFSFVSKTVLIKAPKLLT